LEPTRDRHGYPVLHASTLPCMSDVAIVKASFDLDELGAAAHAQVAVTDALAARRRLSELLQNLSHAALKYAPASSASRPVRAASKRVAVCARPRGRRQRGFPKTEPAQSAPSAPSGLSSIGIRWASCNEATTPACSSR
jgi:hypothetical protein